jgi:hypothetical protein
MKQPCVTAGRASLWFEIDVDGWVQDEMDVSDTYSLAAGLGERYTRIEKFTEGWRRVTGQRQRTHAQVP